MRVPLVQVLPLVKLHLICPVDVCALTCDLSHVRLYYTTVSLSMLTAGPPVRQND